MDNFENLYYRCSYRRELEVLPLDHYIGDLSKEEIENLQDNYPFFISFNDIIEIGEELIEYKREDFFTPMDYEDYLYDVLQCELLRKLMSLVEYEIRMLNLPFEVNMDEFEAIMHDDLEDNLLDYITQISESQISEFSMRRDKQPELFQYE